MRRQLIRSLRTLIGDDGTGPAWARLTADGLEILRLACVEANELGHPCLADEHVLLGLLRHGDSEASRLLTAHGLNLAAVRAEVGRSRPRGQFEAVDGAERAVVAHAFEFVQADH